MSYLVEHRDLLTRFRAADARALREVFLHYAPEVGRFLRRGFSFRAGERHVRFAGYQDNFSVEDGLQEVFRRAFSVNARLAYDGLRPYRAYLLTIAKNAVINEFNTRRRELAQVGFEELPDVAADADYSATDDPLADDAGATTGHPEHDAETRELKELVQAYVGTLEAREAQVFRLRFADGLSHAEIDAAIGLSASKIKTTEERIRKGLLRFMHQHGYFAGRTRRQPHTRTGEFVPQGEKP